VNIAASIAQAALPDTHTVCGVRLRPFSIGHWLYLTRFNVSFVVSDSETHTLGDLLMGVIVCSDTWAGLQTSLLNGDLAKAVKGWRKSLTGGLIGQWRRQWRRMRGHIVGPYEVLGVDFPIECRNFQNYIDTFGGGIERINDWSIPITKEIQIGKPHPTKSPGVMLILDALQSEIGMKFNDIIDMPIPFVRWLFAVHCERACRSTIVDIDEMNEDQKRADEIAKQYFNVANS
jgi:hypothetical protein